MPSDVLEFTSNATHMQQVCNKDIEVCKSYFSRYTTKITLSFFVLYNHIRLLSYFENVLENYISL